MKSLGKLREWLPNSLMPHTCEAVCRAYLNEIEREIAERYMELPVDAGGVPIRVGDYLQLGDTRGEVVALTYCPTNGRLPWEWQCDTGDWYNTAFAYHVNPRTVEDVLQCAGVSVAAIEDVAAEIRELLGVGE